MDLSLAQQDIDFGTIVTGADLDVGNYEKKFKLWDNVVKDKLLESASSREAIKLLGDDTIYSYAFLRDEEGAAFRYTVYQDAIASLQHNFTDSGPNRFIIFKAANQIGKSKLLINKAIKLATTEDNKNIILVSKSLPQSQFLLASIKHTLNNSIFAESWREDLGDTANTTILTFKKKRDGREIVNRIICAPCGEGLLGYPVHYLFLDEADFYEDAKKFFWKIAYPRTNKTKGQIIIFTNPNPDISRSSSLLWELWHGDLFQKKFTFNYLDAPWNTQLGYDRDKRNSPSYIFASTHDGNFPEEGGAFLTEAEVRDMLVRDWNNTLSSVDRPVYFGIDLGKMRDQTVITIGYPTKPNNEDDKFMNLEVRYIEAFKLKTGYDIIANRIIELKKYYEDNYYGVTQIAFDAAGQKTFGDLLKSKGLSAQEVDFAKKETNKTKLYNDFKLMAEQRKIKIVYDRHMEKQLASLEFTQTELKKLKTVAHKTESAHDDYPDAIAILNHVAVKPSRIPPTVNVIKPKNAQNSEFDEIWKMMGLK